MPETTLASIYSTETMALRASDFVNSIGVVAHLGWWGTAWGIGNGQWAGAETKILAELNYIGVTTVRDAAPLSDAAEYASLARAGIHFDIVQTVNNGQVDIGVDVAAMAAFNATNPGAIRSYEGANEYNTNNYNLNGQNSLNNLSWGAVDDQAMAQAIGANSELIGLKIIAASTAIVSSAPNVGTFVNESNWHVYAGPGQQLQNNIASAAIAARATAPGDPVVFTETGVSSSALSSSTWGVAGSDVVQGLIDTNALLDAYKDGVQQVFLYSLMDDNQASDQDDNFGLFNADGTPKAAATDVHDLTSILSDNGMSANTFTAGTFNYALQNLPSTASSMLLEKSSGTFDIVLWNGNAQLVDPTATAAITPPASNVTVSLGTIYQTVKIFDPIQGVTPIETLSNVGAVVVPLSADPLIIEVEPNPISTTYSPGAAGGTINSMGEDTVDVGTGAVAIDATGPSILIHGGVGGLTYVGTAKANVTGGSGTMNLTLDGSGSKVTGGSGKLTVLDTVGGNTITGGAGQANNGMTVTTTKGSDLITTGAWTATNQITLGAGNDTIVSNGTSTIIGTTGDDNITVNGWWGNVTTSTGASSVKLTTYGVVQTHGSDIVATTSGLTLQAAGPTTRLTAGAGYVWLSGTGVITAAGGRGGGNFDLTQTTRAVLSTTAGAADTIRLGVGNAIIKARGNDTIFAGTGTSTIFAVAGITHLTGGAGTMTFIEQASTASVVAGSGTAVFDLTKGMAGGSLTISGFKPGTDSLHLQGYIGNGIESEQVVGGSTQIVLTDNTKITLAGFTNTTSHSLFS